MDLHGYGLSTDVHRYGHFFQFMDGHERTWADTDTGHTFIQLKKNQINFVMQEHAILQS